MKVIKCPNCGSDHIYEAGPKTMMCETCREQWKKDVEFRELTVSTKELEDFKESFIEDEEQEGSFKEPVEDSPFYDEENLDYN